MRARDHRLSTFVAKSPRMNEATVTSVMEDLGQEGHDEEYKTKEENIDGVVLLRPLTVTRETRCQRSG